MSCDFYPVQALSMRGRDEFGSDIHTSPPQQHSRDDTSENQVTESESPASYTSSTTETHQETATGEVNQREQQLAEETRNQVQEEEHTDVAVIETCATETKEQVQPVEESSEEEAEEDKEDEDEDEDPHLYRKELTGRETTLDGCAIEEDSGTDNSNEEEEEELCDLVQKLHSALLSTPTGKCTGSVEYLNWFAALKRHLEFQFPFLDCEMLKGIYKNHIVRYSAPIHKESKYLVVYLLLCFFPPFILH